MGSDWKNELTRRQKCSRFYTLRRVSWNGQERWFSHVQQEETQETLERSCIWPWNDCWYLSWGADGMLGRGFRWASLLWLLPPRTRACRWDHLRLMKGKVFSDASSLSYGVGGTNIWQAILDFQCPAKLIYQKYILVFWITCWILSNVPKSQQESDLSALEVLKTCQKFTRVPLTAGLIIPGINYPNVFHCQVFGVLYG